VLVHPQDPGAPMGIVYTRKFSNSRSKSRRGKSHMDVERLDRSWVDQPTWQMPQPPNLPSNKPRWSPRSRRGFLLGTREVPVGDFHSHCGNMQGPYPECLRMAEHAPNARMRDILLDLGRTWTRLALEAEQWSQMNRSAARLTKAAAAGARPLA
jgi:hypothetical protein